jgi:Transcriptional regulator PadR-like family
MKEKNRRSSPRNARYAHHEDSGPGDNAWLRNSQRIEQISKGVFRVNAGSLFVALQRLERGSLIRSEWKVSENNRRAKYYLLSERGRKRLSTETREWGDKSPQLRGFWRRHKRYVFSEIHCIGPSFAIPKGRG